MEDIPSVLEDALSLLKDASKTQEAAFLNEGQRHFLEAVASALHENHANPLAFVREVKKLAYEPGQP